MTYNMFGGMLNLTQPNLQWILYANIVVCSCIKEVCVVVTMAG